MVTIPTVWFLEIMALNTLRDNYWILQLRHSAKVLIKIALYIQSDYWIVPTTEHNPPQICIAILDDGLSDENDTFGGL